MQSTPHRSLGSMHRLHLRQAVLAFALMWASCASIAHSQQPESLQAPGPRSLGMNLSGQTYYSTDQAFVDLFRTSSHWISQLIEGGPWDLGEPIALTPEGWVASLEPGRAAATVLALYETFRYPPGLYTCSYEGQGTIELEFDATVISSQPGKIVVSVDPKEALVLRIIETNPADPIRNIHFTLPGYENNHAMQVFNPAFLDNIAPYGFLRFMDWQVTNGSPQKHWADRPTLNAPRFTYDLGVPIEVMIDLCNRLKVNPWFCIPHLADDEYVTNFAQLVKNSLDPALKVYIEHSNEVWNGSFPQAWHAQQQGLALGLSTNPFQAQLFYHSQRSVQIFKIWEQVFGGHDRFIRVLASQHVNTWTAEQVLDFQQAFNHADVLATAPYFGGHYGTPDYAPFVKGWSVEQLLAEMPKDIVNNQFMTQQNAAVASNRGLRLVAYECGQHLAGVWEWVHDEQLTALFLATNRHAGMGDLYCQDLASWVQAGGDERAIFSHMGNYTKWGSWGLSEYLAQPTEETHKLNAVLRHQTALTANCDGSRSPILSIDDFVCFQTNFALADPAADCDGSGSLDINDFICFQTAFAYASGC
jgi:hypothetical protein